MPLLAKMLAEVSKNRQIPRFVEDELAKFLLTTSTQFQILSVAIINDNQQYAQQEK